MSQLPENLKPYFWDTDFEKLDIHQNSDYIIARLYTYGRVEGFFWVEKTYSREEIIHAARTRRDLNAIAANYLKEKYGLREEEMNYYRIRKGIPWR